MYIYTTHLEFQCDIGFNSFQYVCNNKNSKTQLSNARTHRATTGGAHRVKPLPPSAKPYVYLYIYSKKIKIRCVCSARISKRATLLAVSPLSFIIIKIIIINNSVSCFSNARSTGRARSFIIFFFCQRKNDDCTGDDKIKIVAIKRANWREFITTPATTRLYTRVCE